MEQVFRLITGPTSMHYIAPLDQDKWGPYWNNVNTIWRLWNRNPGLKQNFLVHNEHIRAIVPPKNLLEFTAADGWGPLCEFLGTDLPDEPYPHLNESSTSEAHLHSFWWVAVKAVTQKYIVLALSVMILGGAILYRSQNEWLSCRNNCNQTCVHEGSET